MYQIQRVIILFCTYRQLIAIIRFVNSVYCVHCRTDWSGIAVHVQCANLVTWHTHHTHITFSKWQVSIVCQTFQYLAIRLAYIYTYTRILFVTYMCSWTYLVMIYYKILLPHAQWSKDGSQYNWYLYKSMSYHELFIQNSLPLHNRLSSKIYDQRGRWFIVLPHSALKLLRNRLSVVFESLELLTL